jgi:hypothetical protein
MDCVPIQDLSIYFDVLAGGTEAELVLPRSSLEVMLLVGLVEQFDDVHDLHVELAGLHAGAQL